eukprot:CAMPEP_0204240502 /NCGR_PEP_ID=MMETSP0361-20130328/94918_1 /ASSEMBLY_ACC=CAM_ASM_000343 /TAXON_ID=268821 /ORGANISM="Scrippsiella Hangoei, Strain SHTV-5" /LENGTH=315 /DNA_ID=CAMNT_0051213307 /DNA_START=61 /DNA_END=1005 /DNA_ORIENTATION=+
MAFRGPTIPSRSSRARALPKRALRGLVVATSAGALALAALRGSACGFAAGGFSGMASAAAAARQLGLRQSSPIVMSARLSKIKDVEYAPVDIEQFYQETIVNGTGGSPIGIERDLITKFFGGGNHFGQGDHAAALESLKQRMVSGEGVTGDNDGQGWIWLVSDNSLEKGFTAFLRKSPPVGLRPLLVAKQDNVQEVFDKVNWSVVRRRFNEILGERDQFGRRPGDKNRRLEDLDVDDDDDEIKAFKELSAAASAGGLKDREPLCAGRSHVRTHADGRADGRTLPASHRRCAAGARAWQAAGAEGRREAELAEDGR